MTSRRNGRATTPVWHSAAIGCAVGIIVVVAWWLLYSLGALTFPAFDLGDLIIRASPGRLATWAIETLGTRAQPAALAGGLLVWIVVWGAFGVIARRIPDARLVAALPLVLLPAALWLASWSEDGTSVGRLLWLSLVFGASLIAGGILLRAWVTRLSDVVRESESTTTSWLDRPGDQERREFIRHVALVTAGFGAGGMIVGRWLRGLNVADVTTAAGIPLAGARAAVASPVALGTPEPAPQLSDTFVAPVGLRPRVTANDEFYVVDISTRNPNLEEMSWALRVHGLVEREVLMTWSELLSLPSIELDGTLMCISYEHDNGLISTTRWTGVRLRDVLERAGVVDGTVDLICRGSNGYSDSIPLAKALEPMTLLAYGMNGTTLPRSHGFPCRLYVPGLYGEKNVKWLQEIELTDSDYLGYWQERGWTDIATINTVSIIDTPRGTALLDSDIVPVAGIAFAGKRGISSVQVRIDDGDWQTATLEANEPPLIWQRWRFDWRPSVGSYRLSVRAVDGEGVPQIETERPPHPDGMTGLHTVSVDVV